MPDDSWVKRVVEDQRRLAARDAAEARHRADIERLVPAFWAAFVTELQRVLDEYHGYDGAVRVAKNDAPNPAASGFSVALRGGQPTLSWSFTVNPAAATAQAIWAVNNGEGAPALEHRSFRLTADAGQLLWDGLPKPAAAVAQEILESWLRSLVVSTRE